MKFRFLSLSFLAVSACAFACSPANDSDLDPDGAGAAASGSGGVAGGSGGAQGSGGDGLASGGALGSGGSVGTGGEGSGTGGGTAGTGFVCPAGSDALVLDASGKTPTEITGVPEVTGDNRFLEGPVWFKGALYISQLRDWGDPVPSRVLKYTPGGSFEVAIEESGSNGLAIDGRDLLISANHRVSGIATLDPTNTAAAPVVLADMYNGAIFNSPNDLTIRNDGTIYFTDPTWQCGGCSHQPVKGVYRIPPGGTPELVATATQDNPNGIALSPDQNTLYIGGNKLTAHPIAADGSVGTGSDFGGVTGTDGLGVDCAGNVYAAINQGGEMKVLSPSGSEITKFSGLPSVTNAAFGGPNNTTLFITTQEGQTGKLYSVELNVPGFPY